MFVSQQHNSKELPSKNYFNAPSLRYTTMAIHFEVSKCVLLQRKVKKSKERYSQPQRVAQQELTLFSVQMALVGDFT